MFASFPLIFWKLSQDAAFHSHTKRAIAETNLCDETNTIDKAIDRFPINGKLRQIGSMFTLKVSLLYKEKERNNEEG